MVWSRKIQDHIPTIKARDWVRVEGRWFLKNDIEHKHAIKLWQEAQTLENGGLKNVK